MTSKQETHFFLGANSPAGFYSIYDNFTEKVETMLYILKGGPGCGKSSFMRTIADGVCADGQHVEYIHCSGDPNSLDAVYFPDTGIGYIDGTAPHVTEASFPAATAQYLNLGRFYDVAAIRPCTPQIAAIHQKYKAFYKDAYTVIAAAQAVSSLSIPTPPTDILQAVEKRAAGTISREIPKQKSEPGTAVKRFLSALTCSGSVYRYDTVPALAQRTFLLDNDCGLAPYFLDPIAAAALKSGYDIIVCPDHLAPQRIRHLFVPALSLAFVSQTSVSPYPFDATKHIRLDAMFEKGCTRQDRIKRRTYRKIGNALLDDAVELLWQAKSLHDDLEAVYNPHVDFDGVYALAETHLTALRGGTVLTSI